MVGSGASGGWAAKKRFAEAGLRVAVLEAGRKLTDADYREHVPAYELPDPVDVGNSETVVGLFRGGDGAAASGG